MGTFFKDPVGHHSTTRAISFGLRSEANLHGATTAFSLTKDVEAVEISADSNVAYVLEGNIKSDTKCHQGVSGGGSGLSVSGQNHLTFLNVCQLICGWMPP